MTPRDIKAKLPAIREAMNKALAEVAKQHGLPSLMATSAKYGAEGYFTFKVEGVLAGGLDKEGAAYEQMQEVLGLPKLGTEFSYHGKNDKIIGLNSTATKVVTQRADGKKYLWPVESIKRIVGTSAPH